MRTGKTDPRAGSRHRSPPAGPRSVPGPNRAARSGPPGTPGRLRSRRRTTPAPCPAPGRTPPRRRSSAAQPHPAPTARPPSRRSRKTRPLPTPDELRARPGSRLCAPGCNRAGQSGPGRARRTRRSPPRSRAAAAAWGGAWLRVSPMGSRGGSGRRSRRSRTIRPFRTASGRCSRCGATATVPSARTTDPRAARSRAPSQRTAPRCSGAAAPCG